MYYHNITVDDIARNGQVTRIKLDKVGKFLRLTEASTGNNGGVISKVFTKDIFLPL